MAAPEQDRPGLNPESDPDGSPVESKPEEVVAEEPAGDIEPEGPDLSSLSSEARAQLDAMLIALEPYGPQPGTLGDLPQVTVERQHIVDVCRTLKDDDRFGANMLLCLSAVDYPPGSPGGGLEPVLQMVYILQSLEPVDSNNTPTKARPLVLKTEAPYDDPVVPSVTGVWRAADWYEREAHDLFGISFDGHPDLTPLLLYDEFEGYPGRKEFPFYEYREF